MVDAIQPNKIARDLVERLEAAKASGQLEEPVLGPLTKSVKAGARWTDKYPAWQKYSDELEQILEFARAHGQFDNYCGALRGSDSQRDSAIAELRVALHLEQVGFPIIEWCPRGYGNSQGEFLVETPGKHRAFVEVKSPSWKGELSDWNGKKRDAGQMERLKQPKYVNDEGGSVAPWQGVRFAVDKAYKEQSKFKDDMPNLLVVADDMFVSAAHNPELTAFQALYSPNQTDPGYFTDKRYERLGGVGIFWFDKEVSKPSVGYHMKLFLNPNSLAATELPPAMCRAFDGRILQG